MQGRGENLIQINQWIEAENDEWIGEKPSNEDPVGKNMITQFKIAYQAGKGEKLVPMLIFDDCWLAMKKLCDAEIRMQANVQPKK
jgi:hypothetical protein